MTKYVVFKNQPEFRQASLQDLLYCDDDTDFDDGLKQRDLTGTRTFNVYDTWRYRKSVNIYKIIEELERFNKNTEHLREVDRHSLYYTFYIPKKTRGYRKIDAPNADLMLALRYLKSIFEEKCVGYKSIGGFTTQLFALYHTAAFAYIKRRGTVDCLRKHQKNDSNWYAKFDLSNFFGSTTLEYTMQMFSRIFPFSEICKYTTGRNELEKALELAFLDGGLPQGTPISPLITNIIMIPVDFELYNGFRNFKCTDRNGEEREQRCVYTRYADDFIVSSRLDFKFKEAQEYINSVLAKFNAPFKLNEEKTRYGSRSGSNWNLGLMIGQDNKISLGHARKKRLKAMISNYVMDKKSGVRWPLEVIQEMDGLRSYYYMIDSEGADGMMAYLSNRFNVNIMEEIKNDLRAA